MMHISQARFVQFTNQKKVWNGTNSTNRSLEVTILQGLKFKLMLKLPDISKVCYKIQGLNSYNLLTDKEAEIVPWAIYRPDEKS